MAPLQDPLSGPRPALDLRLEPPLDPADGPLPQDGWALLLYAIQCGAPRRVLASALACLRLALALLGEAGALTFDGADLPELSLATVEGWLGGHATWVDLRQRDREIGALAARVWGASVAVDRLLLGLRALTESALRFATSPLRPAERAQDVPAQVVEALDALGVPRQEAQHRVYAVLLAALTSP